MAKANKSAVPSYNPDSAGRSGNEGRAHPHLVHPGYFDPALRSTFYPHVRSEKEEAAAADG